MPFAYSNLLVTGKGGKRTLDPIVVEVMSKKIPIELWSALALLAAVAFVGIVGGLYYAGWNLHEVFIDNPDRVLVWFMVIGEALGILLLWASRPWRVR